MVIYMNKIFFIIAIFLYPFLLQAQLIDYFPLAEGNYFKYKFTFHENVYQDLYAYTRTSKSGTVKFNIISSVISDSSIRWTVNETDSLFIQTINVDEIISLHDTSYTLYQHSQAFYLWESTDSVHTLTASSLSGVWDSPTSWNSSWAGFLTGKSINRYSNNHLFQYYFGFPTYDDSIYFVKNIGIQKLNSYVYRLSNIPNSTVVSVELLDYLVITGIKDALNPQSFYLSQNYPNPFNPSTSINYQIPKQGKVTLKIFDVLGKEVASLINEHQNAGRYKVNFDASMLPSGIYFYQLKVNDFISIKKMVLLK